MSDWVETLQAGIRWQRLSNGTVQWRHQKWAWHDDVITFKIWMSISHELNVRLSWNFASRYKMTTSIKRHSLVTSQKWAWPDDVLNFKIRMSMSQELNVRLSCIFAGIYKVTTSIKWHSLVTSQKVGVAWWRHQFQNVNVIISGTKCPIKLKLCRQAYGDNIYQMAEISDVIKSGRGMMTSSLSKF